LKTVGTTIFGPKRDEITGEWRKLHTEELHNLYSCSNIRQIKPSRMIWEGHVACMGEEGKCTSFGGKAQRKETTWEVGVLQWIQLADYRECGDEPQDSGTMEFQKSLNRLLKY
jgi:hypothetical protein